jgi:hypothetical protein
VGVGGFGGEMGFGWWKQLGTGKMWDKSGGGQGEVINGSMSFEREVVGVGEECYGGFLSQLHLC